MIVIIDIIVFILHFIMLTRYNYDSDNYDDNNDFHYHTYDNKITDIDNDDENK